MALSNSIELFDYRAAVIANDGVDERTWDDIDLKFKVRKTADTKPNKMELEIYNLNDESRVFLDPKHVNIQLKAGYQKNFGLIFRGASEFTGHEFGELEWNSKITALDGAIQRRNTFINMSFKKGTEHTKVIEALIKKLVATPEIQEQFAKINQATKGKIQLLFHPPQSTTPPESKKGKKPKKPKKTEAQKAAEKAAKKKAREQKSADNKRKKGMALFGAAHEKLDLFCRAFNLRAYWTDQTLSIVPQDAAIDDELIILDFDSGLLGSPERIETGWRIVSQLRHEFNPGRMVYVASAYLEGQFLIEVVEHEGDTQSDTWQTTLEVRDVGVIAA